MSSDTTTGDDAGAFGRLQTVDASALKVPLGVLAIALLMRPVVSHPLLLGYRQIANTILIWILFATSFNVLLGYAGLLSFGHAMFLGIGTYAVAIGLAQFDVPFLLAAPLGVLLATVVAYLVARMIAEKGEIYFAFLTLAFAKSVHFVANYDPGGLTGGISGLADGTFPTWIETVRGFKYVVVAGVPFDWYYLVASAFVVAMLAMWQLVRSPFGRTLVAVRENQTLARAMGVDVRRYKVWAFTFAGAFAAFAGVLLEVNNHGATLSVLSVTTSGDAILMTVLGGANYFFGPAAGAFVWLFAEDYLTEFHTLVLPLLEYPMVRIQVSGLLTYWQFFLGLLFVVAVLVSPREGVWGLLRNSVDSLTDRVTEGSE